MITENTVLKTLIKTEGFFKDFVDQLKYMFPHIKEWTDATFDDVTSSMGWKAAFVASCKKFNLTEVEEFYGCLDWSALDLFDERLVSLIIILCSEETKEESKIRCYTPRWNNFQIRDVVYIDGHIDPNKFDVIRWCTHEPIECIDGRTGLKKTSTESCYTVATLDYSPKDNSFELHSCGMRFLNDYEEGLCQWILEWCNNYTEEQR